MQIFDFFKPNFPELTEECKKMLFADQPLVSKIQQKPFIAHIEFKKNVHRHLKQDLSDVFSYKNKPK